MESGIAGSSMREGREPLRYASFYYSIVEPRSPGCDDFKRLLFFYHQGLIEDEALVKYFSDQVPVFDEFCEGLEKEIGIKEAMFERRVKKPSEILKKTLACEGSDHPLLPSEKGSSIPVVYINDVFAARVIVPDVDMIYGQLVPFLKDKFSLAAPIRDYIESPKPRTGYQSYHMDIWIPYSPNFVIELQLRTNQMHKRALKDEHWKKGCIRKPPRIKFKRMENPKQAGRDDKQMTLFDLLG